ncbi:MAG: SprB repeat-containing protein, partial [Bacteroidota bacterium]
YDVAILYAGGMCSEDLSFQIAEPAPLQTNFAAVTPVSCAGRQNGSINLSFSGGTAPYTYLWSDGRQTEDLTNAGAGTYSVTVTDASQCTLDTTFLVEEPLPIILADTSITHIACYGQQTGVINTVFTGGTTPYQFLWSNGTQTGYLAGAGAGMYSVTLTDSRQCTFQ